MKKRPLVACANCSCHVRIGEAECPFCGAPGPSEAAPAGVLRGRVSSLMVMTFRAATVTAALGGCGGQVDTPAPGPSSAGGGGSGGSGGSGGAMNNGGSTDNGGATNNGGAIDVGSGGQIDLGTGGDLGMGGGPVPIYRATPRG